MAIAATLEQYLADHHVDYEVIDHTPTMTASRSAQQSHVSGDRLAKAVVVKDEQGLMVAVVPASHHIKLGALSELLDRRIGLASEDEADAIFADCEHGAFPAIGAAYGLPVILDDSIAEQPEVYFEGGDHASLIHVGKAQFHALLGEVKHGRFSAHD